MSQLVAVEGPLRGKSFGLGDSASIGRDEKCAIRIEGTRVSRVHCLIEKRGDALHIKDNASRNGIFINGRKVTEAALRPDDEIEVGEHVLVFDPTGDPLARARVIGSVVESLSIPLGWTEPDERLPKVLEVAGAIASSDREKEIAVGLLEALMAAVAPERAFVMVVDPLGTLKPYARKTPAGEEEFSFSNVLSHAVMEERRAIIATDVIRKEPNVGKLIGILCAPLSARGKCLGLAYLDVRMAADVRKPKFTLADLRLTAALCAFAGTRIAQLRRAPARVKVGGKALPVLTAAFEKDCLVEALQRAKGDLDQAGKLLGLKRAELDEKLKGHGIAAPPPPPPGPVEWKSVQV